MCGSADPGTTGVQQSPEMASFASLSLVEGFTSGLPAELNISQVWNVAYLWTCGRFLRTSPSPSGRGEELWTTKKPLPTVLPHSCAYRPQGPQVQVGDITILIEIVQDGGSGKYPRFWSGVNISEVFQQEVENLRSNPSPNAGLAGTNPQAESMIDKS